MSSLTDIPTEAKLLLEAEARLNFDPAFRHRVEIARGTIRLGGEQLARSKPDNTMICLGAALALLMQEKGMLS